MAGFGFASAQAAGRLDRVASTWFALGAILGPIALLLLHFAPPARCRSCRAPTRGWLTVCGWCGEDVALVPATTLALVARMAGPAAAATEASAPRPAEPAETSRQFQIDPGPPTAAAVVAIPSERNGSRPRRSSPAPRTSKGAPKDETDAIPTRVLATAVFVAGSRQLEAGRRYGIAIRGSRLLILGPVEFDPSAVVLDRPAADIDASEVGGRLLISEPRRRSGLVLAFMSVSGAKTDNLAETIRAAAREPIRP